MKSALRWTIWLILVGLLGLPCFGQQTDDGYGYEQPEAVVDGWPTGTLAEAGINEALVGDAIELILSGQYERVHALLIIKDGLLVLEEYFPGSAYYGPTNWSGAEIEFNKDRIHNLASLTKSVTSVLVGAAIQNEFIESVEQSVFSFFPEYSDLLTPENEEITIEHLLTMTSGWEWSENTQWEAENDMYQFVTAIFPLRYVIAQPLLADPGTLWNYNGGAVTLLGKIIEKASGLDVEDFANEYLFGPLGITDYWWPDIRYNLIATHGDLKLRPRDVARIGQLMLNDGMWNNERLLPIGWVDQSIRSSYVFGPGEGFYYYTDYGYLWWLLDVPIGDVIVPTYTAAGWGGQRLIVIPDFNTIVMFNGGNYETAEPVDDIMFRHILPALAQ
ncbi:serine hydrolase domain-containing protein [Candidatus Bipolaricaulota bacterium]